MSIYDELEESIKETVRNQKHKEAGEHLAPLISKEIGDALKPYMDKIDGTLAKVNDAISNIRIESPTVNVTVPDISIPEINIPEIKLPTINVPEANVNVTIPESKMPVFPDFPKEMGLSGVSMETPLPVQLRSADGSPFSFPAQSSGGGKADHFTVKGFDQSAYSDYLNADGRLRVSVESGGGALTDTELRATAVPVSQVSGANWSVSAIGTVTVDGSGVTQPISAGESLLVNQLSGSNWSVSATQVTSPWVVSATDLDIRDLVNTSDSVRVYQLSGASWSVEASLAASSTVNVNGATNSTISVGPVLHDAADDGAAPQKVGGTAMTANPTAVAGGDIVRFVGDDIGRQLVRPVQVRDLVQTAYIQKVSGSTFGTETSFIAGTASEFHDLIYIMASNDSDAATSINIRSGTAGSVIMTLDIPAQGVVGVAPLVPIPQTEVAQAWTIDLPDITGTTISITGLFSREI